MTVPAAAAAAGAGRRAAGASGPAGRGQRGRGLAGPAWVATAGAAAATLLHVHDPHEPGSYGMCPFTLLINRPCLGCGGLRAVNDLTHGDLVGAAGSNALVVAAIVAAAVLWMVWTVRRLCGDRDARFATVTTRGALAVLAAGVVFGVVRMTPRGSWLAP